MRLGMVRAMAGVAVAMGAFVPGPSEGQTGAPVPLKVEDGRFVRDGRPYRGIGVNYFDLFIRVLNAPSNTTTLAGLRQLSEGGIPFVRFALGYGTKDLRRYFDDPAAYFSGLDAVVRCAETNHIGLIPSLFWNFKEFPDPAGEPRDQWGNPGSATHRRMRQFAGDVVARYRASPAIWGWEFGNEPNLAADLPNAAQFRRKGGTERDDIRSKDMVVMLAEFAKEVRRHDPGRPVFAGHSHPRASAWHNTAEKSWTPDTREQTLEILRRDNPEPLDTHSLHVYATHDVTKELAAWATNHADYLGPVVQQAHAMKRPVWIGEFGFPYKGDEAEVRAKFAGLIDAMERTGVDLAAAWVFDLANQPDWTLTFGGPRAGLLRLVAEANRRWNDAAAAPDFASENLAVGFSRSAPAFTRFGVDSLGQGKVASNPVRRDPPGACALAFSATGPGRFAYALGGTPAWSVECAATSVVLVSESAGGPAAPPFTLTFDQKANHTTLLGVMKPGERAMPLPCLLHLPDLGTLRITCDVPGASLGYDAVRRIANPPYVRVGFPAATAERPRVAYRLDVVAIHPDLPGVAGKPLYDGFRRDWLNIFQVNPRLQMLANNASSDPCAFTLFKYALVARDTPPLADGLTAIGMVRMTVDRYLAGALGYGQVGYAMTPGDAILVPWETPWTTTDSHASLLVAACVCAEAPGGTEWARTNYDNLLGWARAMMARDTDGDGLVEYPSTGNYGDRPKRERRPSNWWDTINFGHEDAYSNALIHDAARRFASLARSLGHAADAADFEARADRLRAAYAPGFLNPETGILAGWRSADGQLHDYGFTFVNGAAVTFGLLDDAQANAVMDRLLAKMAAVGYTNFAIGLPGNLVPIRRGDYVHQNTPPERFGEPLLEDGSDGFQFYENGGATGCYTYFLIKALYRLGRVADARRILLPMLEGYAAGNFQGFDESGMSRDWRDWKGGGHGYEGLLVDNYLALLAVLDDLKAP